MQHTYTLLQLYHQKKKGRRQIGLQRNFTGELETEEKGETKLDAFFSWSLWVKPFFRNPRFPGQVGKSRERETRSGIISRNWAHTSPWELVMHPSELRALASVIVSSILIIFGRSWPLGEDPEDQKKTNVSPVFEQGKKEDSENYRLVRHTFISGR